MLFLIHGSLLVIQMTFASPVDQIEGSIDYDRQAYIFHFDIEEYGFINWDLKGPGSTWTKGSAKVRLHKFTSFLSHILF